MWRNTVWRIDPHLLGPTGGRISTALVLPTALLETRGARTGLPRRNGVIYFSRRRPGDDRRITGRSAGASGLVSQRLREPRCAAGGQPFRVEVIEDEAARTRLWELADRVFPAFAAYRENAASFGRTIPILQLVRL